MKKMCTAKEVAKHILYHYSKKEVYISNSYLQKVLYILQCYYYDEYGYPLFEDDIRVDDGKILVNGVYSEYQSYGDKPIIYLDGDTDIVDEYEKRYLDDLSDELLYYSNMALDEIVLNDVPVIEAQRSEHHIVNKDSIKKFYSWWEEG